MRCSSLGTVLAYLACSKPLVQSPAHTCPLSPRTWEVETGRWIKFKAILSSFGGSKIAWIHDSVSENSKHIRNKKGKGRGVVKPAAGRRSGPVRED